MWRRVPHCPPETPSYGWTPIKGISPLKRGKTGFNNNGGLQKKKKREEKV